MAETSGALELRRPDYTSLERLAKACAASGYFKDATDAAKAYVKVVAGDELGIGPIQAMTGIHIVQGKPTLSAGLVGALIKRSGRYDYRVKILTDLQCTLEFFEHGQSVGESTFAKTDAEQAGLTKNPTWKSFPRNMLLSRALTNGARWYCPDVFGGAVYTPDEMGAVVDAEGDVVELPETGPVKESPLISSGEGDARYTGDTQPASATGGINTEEPAGGERQSGQPGAPAEDPLSGGTAGSEEPLASKATLEALNSYVANLVADGKLMGEQWAEIIADIATPWRVSDVNLINERLEKATTDEQQSLGEAA